MLIAQSGRMGPLRLRNRIIMGPMGTNFGTTDGFATERDKFYYGERARGGAAMIITEAMVITAGARNHTNSRCATAGCSRSPSTCASPSDAGKAARTALHSILVTCDW